MSVIEAMARATVEQEIGDTTWGMLSAGNKARVCDMLRAALSEARKMGWQLVPVEPTEDMVKAACNASVLLTVMPMGEALAACYQRLLAAAPSIEDGK